MAKDPVCGMDVEPKESAGTSTYKGETIYFCSLPCKERFDADPEAFVAPVESRKEEHHKKMMAAGAGAHETAKDPICGMVVDKQKSLKKDLGGRTYYFCSDGCLRTFEAPEEELKSMKKRVTIALFGVLALAILRAAFFLGLGYLAVVRFGLSPYLVGGIYATILIGYVGARWYHISWKDLMGRFYPTAKTT